MCICNKIDLCRVMRKPAFCICKNKDADQLRGKRADDQSLWFCYKDKKKSLYFLNTQFEPLSYLLWLYSRVCVGPGRKPRRQVFSRRGSFVPLHEMTALSFHRILFFFRFFSNMYVPPSSGTAADRVVVKLCVNYMVYLPLFMHTNSENLSESAKVTTLLPWAGPVESRREKTCLRDF